MRFGKFAVDTQVFYRTDKSFALVNLKPLLPYHVLVCPVRVVPRLKDLSADEVFDLFSTVQKVSNVVEQVAKADALNIAIQDGAIAGQSVPHVHCHIIPRKAKDIAQNDEIYKMLESPDADYERLFELQKKQFQPFPAPDDASRQPRSPQEMEAEAKFLSSLFTDPS